MKKTAVAVPVKGSPAVCGFFFFFSKAVLRFRKAAIAERIFFIKFLLKWAPALKKLDFLTFPAKAAQ